MSDRELLELAAKATGHCYSWSDKYKCLEIWRDDDKIKRFWLPHRDDGDALRLAVKLGISVFSPDCAEYHNDGDVYASVRLAIVRAAAEIGKQSNVPVSGGTSSAPAACSASSYWGPDGRCVHCGAGNDAHHSYTCPTNMHPDKREPNIQICVKSGAERDGEG